MAFKRKLEGETLPEKVVIVTGPTLGTIVGFIALGVAVGAAGALYWRNSQSTLAGGESGMEGFGGTTDGERRINSLVERLHRLQARIKNLASRTRDTVHTASEVLGPVLHEAVNEAKSAARDAEEELQAELDKVEISGSKQEATKADGAGDPSI